MAAVAAYLHARTRHPGAAFFYRWIGPGITGPLGISSHHGPWYLESPWPRPILSVFCSSPCRTLAIDLLSALETSVYDNLSHRCPNDPSCGASPWLSRHSGCEATIVGLGSNDRGVGKQRSWGWEAKETLAHKRVLPHTRPDIEVPSIQPPTSNFSGPI